MYNLNQLRSYQTFKLNENKVNNYIIILHLNEVFRSKFKSNINAH